MSADKWVLQIEADIDSMLDEIDGYQAEARSLTESRFEPLLVALDLALVLLCDLALAAIDSVSAGQPIWWPEIEMAGKEAKPSWILQIVMTNLANTLLAMRTLVCAGLDNQARILYRSYVELADAVLVAADDEESFSKFSTAPSSFKQARKIWERYLKPSMNRERVLRIHKEFGVPEDVLSAWREGSRHRYDWLTQWTHHNIIPLSMGSMPRMVDSNLCALNLGGSCCRF